MKRIKRVVAILMVTGTVALSGCSMWTAPYGTEEGSAGAIYTDLTVGSPLKDNPNSTSLKKGEACSVAIIGFQTDGDSSTQTAMKNGNIKRLVSVKHHITSVLGLYTKVCTIAKGR
jgi:hypothetical protein